MAGREPVHGVDGGGAAGREQNLVAHEKSTVALEICEIVVVECVWSCRVEIYPIVVTAGRTRLDKDVSVGRVECRVGALGSVEIVESSAEESAS